MSYNQYPNHFCLYKMSTTPLGIETHQINGPSFSEIRQNVASLDCHLKFSTAVTTSLELVVMMIFEDSLEICKTETAERDILLSFSH